MAIRGARQTLTDEAHDRVRTAIVRGTIRPNEHLVETDLAERFHISRTPVREVLQRLSIEGLIVRGRRGWIVREHTPDEIRQLYEVRTALEGFAARLASERGDDAALERIVAIHRGSERSNSRTAREYLVDVNDDFHQAVLDASGNDRLEEFARQSHEFFFNYRIAQLYTDEEAAKSLEEHDAIVLAITARDASGAERLMRDHIGRALDVTLRKLR
jgi:DNA-binding GntR family transcriptional regulator